MVARDRIAGSGIGLRAAHIDEVVATKPRVPWFELLADNYFSCADPLVEKLVSLRRHYPMTLHSVGLSVGSPSLNHDYLARLTHLVEKLNPAFVSDHMCWTHGDGYHFHELLPLPFTAETVNVVVDKVKAIQDSLGRELLLENVSSYLTYRSSTMPEWEFLHAVCERADCGLLLDVNNLYVSARNHGFSSDEYWTRLPRSRIKQYHMAGFEDMGTHLLDTHGGCVAEPVWALYQTLCRQLGPRPTCLEWDTHLPDFQTLYREAKKCDAYCQRSRDETGRVAEASVACAVD